MKRLFFLLIVAVACVLPQSVWADAVLSGTTLTITTTEPGQVAGFVSSLESKSSVTKIVLDGKFNETDLQAIKSTGDGAQFTGVTEVDMKDAQFVSANTTPSQATYKLYSTEGERNASSPSNGERAIVGGTLYKSAQTPQWNIISAPGEGTTFVSSFDKSTIIGYTVGDYGKDTPVTKFVKMQVTGESWSGPNNKGYNNFNEPSSATELTTSTTEDAKLSEVLHDYYAGQYVYFYRYFKCESYQEDEETKWRFIPGTSADYNSATSENQYDNPSGVDLNALSNYYAGDGKVMRVKVYYQKQETSRSWTGDTTDDPGSSIDLSAYEYAYRNNHKYEYTSGVFKNNDWVKLTDYTYYQLQATGAWRWEVVTSVAEGEAHYINVKYPSETTDPNDNPDELPNADNQYAVVMGTEYFYDVKDWIDPNDSPESPHYSDMKFSYWSSTLTKATTSKYADENINPDIFQNCNKLTEVDFKAGVVKGFTDHNTSYGLTVNIGQNVTKIASDAFIRCNDLETLTFDAGIDVDNISGKTYPLALEIRDGAFQACENLKNVVIPNRVTVIGNDAFKEAGGKTAGTEFKVTFQRRYTDSTPKTAIDGWKEGMNLTIGTDAFAYCKNLKEISLPIRMTSMGDGIFQNSGLEKYEIREDIEEALVTTIPSNAFLACKLKEINIPRSVTLIESGAFSNTPTIETIRFQKQLGSTQNPLTIKTGAFAGGNEENQSLKDVYVDFEPTERLVICEYNAFNFTSMVGQTNESSTKFATLHFPNTDTAWDFYQGDWKRGLAFKQTSLNSFKDGYTGKWGGVDSENVCVGMGTASIGADGRYHKDDVDDKLIAPANGWQQFFATSSDIDIIIPRGSFMRTYSSNSPYIIPKFTQNETGNGITVKAGDPMFDIYRITEFSDGYKDGQDKTSASLAQAAKREATATKVDLPDRIGRNYIPSVTGLMMVGKINADYVVYFAKPDFTSEVEGTYKDITETTYPYNISKYEETGRTNLLYPSCIDNQRMDGNDDTSSEMTGEPKIINDGGVSKILLYSSIPYPYHSYDGDLKFRLFGYYATPNQFKRVNNAKVTRDKAYLKLPKEMFHWANEYTEGTEGGSTSGVNDPTAAAAAREISLSFLEDEEESGTTGIKQIDTTAQRMDSNVFYTLEGVRLNARPTQRGIYIHNGRKIVIK